MSIIEQRKEALAKEILDTVDLVTWVASLDPTEWNQGEPAYSPEFQRLIVKAKDLHEAEDNGADLRLRIGGEAVVECSSVIDVYADLVETDEEGERRVQVTCTNEGVAVTVFRDGITLGESAQTWEEVHNKIA